MLSPQALIRGIVARALPPYLNADSPNNDVGVRQWSYGEVATQPMMRKAHALADEGSYYTVTNAQTAIATAYATSFSATAASYLIYNGNTQGQRAYLDYLSLSAIVAGANTTAVGYIAYGITIDNINRYSSGGTVLTPQNVNMAAAANASGVSAYFGGITAAAASGAARTIVGQRYLRPSVSSTVMNVVGDNYFFNFGGVEQPQGSSAIIVADPTMIQHSLPPIVIAPGHSALLHIWFPILTAPSAATFAVDAGFWVR